MSQQDSDVFDFIDELIAKGIETEEERLRLQITKNLGSKAPSFKDGFVLNC